jgi:hypothetical protein
MDDEVDGLKGWCDSGFVGQGIDLTNDRNIFVNKFAGGRTRQLTGAGRD